MNFFVNRISHLLILVSLLFSLYLLEKYDFLPRINPPYDKLVHATAYGSALLLAGWVLRPTFWRCLGLALLGMAVGVGQEWHQSLLPGRVASVEDWLADLAGLAVGLVFCWLLSCWQRRCVATGSVN